MIKFFSIIILISPFFYCQSDSFDFFSSQNIKKFADHLYCEGDYLRAVEQYQSIQQSISDDTTDYKIIYAYSLTGYLQKSNELFKSISTESDLYPAAHLLSLKNQLLLNRKSILTESGVSDDSVYLRNLNKLRIISMLYDEELSYSRERFTYTFDEDEKIPVSKLYDEKFNPPNKDAIAAGVLSAIIPGSGKMYVGEWGDGIAALITTGLLAFLAVDNFEAGHDTRAWIFTALGGFFYIGNIYGSVAAAQIFNARIDFEFNAALNLFLEEKNYFVPVYDFCN